MCGFASLAMVLGFKFQAAAEGIGALKSSAESWSRKRSFGFDFELGSWQLPMQLMQQRSVVSMTLLKNRGASRGMGALCRAL